MTTYVQINDDGTSEQYFPDEHIKQALEQMPTRRESYVEHVGNIGDRLADFLSACLGGAEAVVDDTYEDGAHFVIPGHHVKDGLIVPSLVEATAIVNVEASGNAEIMIEDISDMEGLLFPYGINHREGVLTADLDDCTSEAYSVPFPVSLVIEVSVACMASPDGTLTSEEEERVEVLAADEIDLPDGVYVDCATLDSVEID